MTKQLWNTRIINTRDYLQTIFPDVTLHTSTFDGAIRLWIRPKDSDRDTYLVSWRQEVVCSRLCRMGDSLAERQCAFIADHIVTAFRGL